MNQQPFTQPENAPHDRLFFACQKFSLFSPVVLRNHLSDPHNGGQCAVLFAYGENKYIYKPRPGRADWAWVDFLTRMQEITGCLMPRAVEPVSAREDEYTIVPYVEGREAESEEEIRRYYERCGAMLALCMVLGSTDLHEENLIADGDSPLLVDVETLLSGLTMDKAAREPVLYDKLIFSHLLPNWMLENGENRDLGALTAKGKNMPRLQGEYCEPWRHINEIIISFRNVCDAMMKNREDVKEALLLFQGSAFRKLLRPTDLYARLCRQIGSMETEDEKIHSANRLRRAYARAGEAWQKQMEKVCESEIAALLRGDIPYFYSLAEETNLRAMEGIVAEGYFALSPLEAAVQRLQALQSHHVEEQTRIIRQSLQAACPEIYTPSVQTAMDVFHLIEENAVDENPCSFMGLMMDDRGEACFQSIGFGLYDGLMGVLVFYAALYEATGHEQVLRALEKRYAAYHRQFILPNSPIYAAANTLSLTNGLAGHIIGLGYIARCVQDTQYVKDAALLYSCFRFAKEIVTDGDVYNGTAGLLIALPLLIGLGMDDALAQTANLLAKDILELTPTLTGFAHGAAGTALALGAAEYLTGKDYSEKILQLLAWENAMYSEKDHNWPDLRNAEKQGYMKGLCSGAPGIGLSRKQLIRYTKNEEIRRICHADIQKTVQFLEKQTASKRDTFCCGNASLIEAACTLGCSTACLNEKITLYHSLGTNDFPIGLFQGWAGAGYAMVRMMAGSKSSLFVWETKE